MSGQTSTEIWSVAKLVTALDPKSPIGHDKTIVRIPRFQRPLVWSQEKQEALIKSVLKGFPIGTLLLWQDPENPTSYLLVDGQQRSATLMQHASSDLALLTRSAVEESATISQGVEVLLESINHVNSAGTFVADELFQDLLEWLHSQQKTQSPSFHNASLLASLSQQSQRFDGSTQSVANSAHQLLNAIRDAVDVSRMNLPVLIYRGPGADLDDIFVKINEQGVALTKYQVWAALWAETEVATPNKDVLDEQDLRTQALQDQGLIYEEEGPASKINLFEYLNATGHLLSRRYPELFRPVDHPAEQAFSFSVAALYFGLDLSRKSASTLPDQMQISSPTVMSDFFKNFDAACRCVNKMLNEVAALKLTERQGLLPHPELQMVSLVAWISRELRAGRGIDGVALADSVKAIYVLDLLTQPFRGPGDKLAFERVQATDSHGNPSFYRSKPTKSEFSRSIETWLAEDRKNTKKKRPVTQEALKRFMLRLISSRVVPVNEQAKFTFDVDHIQALGSALFKQNSDSSALLAPHEIGNLCLLEHQLNLRKGKQALSVFMKSLNDTEKELVVRVGRLAPELIDGVLSDAGTARKYKNNCEMRAASLSEEVLTALGY